MKLTRGIYVSLIWKENYQKLLFLKFTLCFTFSPVSVLITNYRHILFNKITSRQIPVRVLQRKHLVRPFMHNVEKWSKIL